MDASTAAGSDRDASDADVLASLDDSAIPLRPIPPGAERVPGLPGCVLDDGALSCDSLFSWHLRSCYVPEGATPGKVLLVCSEEGRANQETASDLGNNGCMLQRRRVVVVPDPTSPFRVVALTSRREVAAYLEIKTAADALSFALLVDPHAHRVHDGFRSTASGKGPFTLSLVTYEACGCTHPTERVSFTVTKDGTMTEGKRTLLKTTSGLCVD